MNFRKAIFFLLILPLSFFVNGQESFQKEDFIGVWKACGTKDWDEIADTLTFFRNDPNCRDNDCSEQDWKFLESGSVDFIFTKGCNSGFNSSKKPSKKWIYIEDKQRIKLITMDGWIEYFDIYQLDDEKLVLIHRKDLER